MKPFHLIASMTLIIHTGCSTTADLEVVKGFDADRYTGRWYEAARYPHRFEKGMSSVSADYSRNNDGTIKVVNRGYKDDKKQWSEIEGVAKFKDESDNGWLRVSFFKPFYGDYKIIHLDDGYTQAIVASSSRNYLWILVRDPALPQDELEQLIKKTEQFGFEREKLQIIDQSRNQKL